MEYKFETASSVTALNFYDGATEGFAEDISHGRDCYFTLVAWDVDQDERLYGVINVDRELHQRVTLLLSGTQERSSFPVWMPKWEFASANDESEATALVYACRRRLSTEGYLLFGRHMGDKPSRTVEIRGDLIARVDAVLLRGIPEDLSLWKSI
jgi:hypothetical protein